MLFLGKVLVATLWVVSVCGKKYHFSYDLLSKCQEFDANSGYNYKKYFKIDDLSHVIHNKDYTAFRLLVLGSKDAHFLLSPNNSPNATDEVYEIVLGAGNNNFCEIRKQKQKNPIKTKIIKDLLSPIDPLPLIIKLNKTGNIEVWIEHEMMALLSVVDSNPVDFEYISFSSWGGTPIKWFYDCPFDEEENYDIMELNKTAKERLADDLFQDYELEAYHNVVGLSIDTITFSSLIYNAKKENFELRFSFSLKYIDPRLKWNPEDYENITTYFDDQYFWIPGITVLNGLGDSFMDFPTQYHVTVNHEGNLSAISNELVLEVYCDLKTISKGDHYCDMHLSIQESFVFVFVHELDPQVLHIPFQSHWKVDRLDVIQELHTSPTIFEDKDEKYDIIFRFFLKENLSSMLLIFNGIIYGGLAMLMASIYCDLLSRLGMVLMTVMITILSMTTVNTFAPCQYINAIIFHYKISLALAMINLLLTIIGYWFKYFGTQEIPWWLQFGLKEIVRKCSCSMNSYGGLSVEKNIEYTWEALLNVINSILFGSILTCTILLFFFGL